LKLENASVLRLIHCILVYNWISSCLLINTLTISIFFKRYFFYILFNCLLFTLKNECWTNLSGPKWGWFSYRTRFDWLLFISSDYSQYLTCLENRNISAKFLHRLLCNSVSYRLRILVIRILSKINSLLKWLSYCILLCWCNLHLLIINFLNVLTHLCLWF
jgi:hypothetical protein